MAFPLPDDFADLFRREPYEEPAMTGRGAFNRAVLIVAAALVGGVALMDLPTRPFYWPHANGPVKVVASLVLAGLAGAYYVYKIAWRPWREGTPGYRLVGEFEVREKNHLFAQCWVRLAPGHNFQLQVQPELYEQLRVGDWLQLLYTAGGRLVSCTKWAGPGGGFGPAAARP